MPLNRWTTFAIGLASFGVVGLCVLLLPYFLTFHGALATEHGRWGEFGSYVGGVLVAFLTLLTLLALVATLVFQTVQLSQTREDLRAQRSALERQNFEGTFFHLLTRLDAISERVTAETMSVTGRSTITGPDAFRRIFTELQMIYKGDDEVGYSARLQRVHREKTPTPRDQDGEIMWVASAYEDIFKAHESELGPYFRSLNAVLRFIDEHTPDHLDELDYSRIARAQLSKWEVAVLFYNGTSAEGAELRPLVEKFALLKHLSFTTLIIPEHGNVTAWYSPRAFGLPAP